MAPEPPFARITTEAIETALLVIIVKNKAILRIIATTFKSELFIGINTPFKFWK